MKVFSQTKPFRARIHDSGILSSLILGLVAGRSLGGSLWSSLAITAAVTLGLWLALEVGLGRCLERRRARRGITSVEPLIRLNEWAVLGCMAIGAIAAAIVDGSLLDRFAICLGLTVGLIGAIEVIGRSLRAERPVTRGAPESG
jgi:hypothetical protein